jgi:hypothetical protein
MGALHQIREAGFDVALVDGWIEICPADKLTQTQQHFLKSHRAEIISELQAEQIRQAENERRVLAWLSFIGETDPAIIEDTLNRCRADQETMSYFLMRSMEAGL